MTNAPKFQVVIVPEDRDPLQIPTAWWDLLDEDRITLYCADHPFPAHEVWTQGSNLLDALGGTYYGIVHLDDEWERPYYMRTYPQDQVMEVLVFSWGDVEDWARGRFVGPTWDHRTASNRDLIAAQFTARWVGDNRDQGVDL